MQELVAHPAVLAPQAGCSLCLLNVCSGHLQPPLHGQGFHCTSMHSRDRSVGHPWADVTASLRHALCVHTGCVVTPAPALPQARSTEQ
jgi:hypothetical protein